MSRVALGLSIVTLALAMLLLGVHIGARLVAAEALRVYSGCGSFGPGVG